VARRPGVRPKRQRFSVSLPREDYERLVSLGESKRPRLTRSYLVEFAVRLLLEHTTDPRFTATLGNPLKEDA